MTKADVLAKLEEYKDRPIEVGLSDEGALLYSGVDGHWLFVQGDNLVEVKKNISDGTYGFSTVNQQQSPFVVTTVPCDVVNYVRIYITNEPGDIKKVITNMEVVGVSKSLDEVIKEMEGDSVHKASSPRGFQNVSDVNTKTSYGRFKGTAVSTDIDGIPNYMKDDLLKKN